MAFFFFGPSLGLRAGNGDAESPDVSSGVSLRLRLVAAADAVETAGREGFFLIADWALEGPACVL